MLFLVIGGGVSISNKIVKKSNFFGQDIEIGQELHRNFSWNWLVCDWTHYVAQVNRRCISSGHRPLFKDNGCGLGT